MGACAAAIGQLSPGALSPVDFPVIARTEQRRFWLWLDTEADYDGVKLQISIDGGATWTDVTTVTPAYTNLTGGCCGWEAGDAWHGRLASWAGGGDRRPPAWVHLELRLRFAFTTDTSSNQFGGAHIDDTVIFD